MVAHFLALRRHPAAFRAASLATAVAIALTLAACGEVAPAPPGFTYAPGATPGSTALGSGPAATSAIAPGDRLAGAFAAMAGGYTFESTVSLGGKMATHVTGRWIGGASEFVIEASGTSITYRTIPPHAWVLRPVDGWVAVDGTVPGGDPLDALARPRTTTVDADTSAGIRLVGTYPATDLGLAGTGTVKVAILVAPDGSVTATYSADTKSGTASSEVAIRPAANQAPIAAPSLLPAPS